MVRTGSRTERKRKGQRGFVTNELPLVFIVFCLFCLLLAFSIGGALHLAWYWRVLMGLVLLSLGLGGFFTYCFVEGKRQKRATDAAKSRYARFSNK